ncbi:plant invertase/pectin methylesterase inhibitor superfamily [Actinidia rufa]|uniref:Plant invertase/pectin methylesterase inhibitor superfamily n=1 Tax=Actinidia rufa TaxID=165716 RepID=A0A7J0ER90_9ERIC|nr:plant invertase/pectin methylesterase inhibitor superfamily [Actinidia rufa]GFZ16912.1 plant invertase/pectin methylesterase inhibitor superfamily [Actinidia rufa]
MTPMHMHTTLLISLSLFLIIPLSISSTPTFSPEGICNSTPFPSFCKSLLPNNNSATVYDYCRFSIHRSLATTRNFLSLIDGYLKLKNILPQATVRALEDCQFLISLNLDFFSSTIQTIDSTSTLQSSKAEDMLTLLSAILTNQQTCSDGLQSTSLQNALFAPFKNGNMLYSVSLAFFRHGWVHNTRKGRWTEEGIFATIGDAVAAAPNNTAAGGGYYLIYVVAGVYEEYVSIAKNKHYLMVVGDGINRTIITGNRSVVDGWTTFNSATFVVVGQGFVAMNLTIRNTAGAAKHQAVALRSEYANRGPGSSTANRVTWPGYHVISATDAANFTVLSFVSGDSWLPAIGVPYTAGLI